MALRGIIFVGELLLRTPLNLFPEQKSRRRERGSAAHISNVVDTSGVDARLEPHAKDLRVCGIWKIKVENYRHSAGRR